MQESMKEKTKSKFIFSIQKITPNLFRVDITIDSSIIKPIYNKTLETLQKNSNFPGFKKEEIPLNYLEKNFKGSINTRLKNYLFKHYVLDFLIDKIHQEKISMVNYPRLEKIRTNKNNQMIFSFNISVAPKMELKEWKFFIFRAPKRKKYKDLDKQVNLFIKRELTMFKKNNPNIVEEDDWVLFETNLINDKNQGVLENHKSNFWIKINNKYITQKFHSLLIGKKIGESIITNTLAIKNDFSPEQEENNFCYKIKIKKIAKGKNFSLESFKNIFKLKSKIDVHNKLIEVFSYRNDISQRRAIIEEIFHLLLSKHRFEVPKHFTIRRQENILKYLKKHPDYIVYKQNKDFIKQLAMLADKQLKEEILMDQLAYKENLIATQEDIKNYLYLFNNNRLKEFVYFKPILQKLEDIEAPLQTGILKQFVLREKTLNHIIYELTK